MAIRNFTEKDLDRIATIMYNIASSNACNVYDGHGLPICRMWDDLSNFEKRTSTQGLKERIERETLSGYFERKKNHVPAATGIYEETIRALKAEGFL